MDNGQLGMQRRAERPFGFMPEKKTKRPTPKMERCGTPKVKCPNVQLH